MDVPESNSLDVDMGMGEPQHQGPAQNPDFPSTGELELHAEEFADNQPPVLDDYSHNATELNVDLATNGEDHEIMDVD